MRNGAGCWGLAGGNVHPIHGDRKSSDKSCQAVEVAETVAELAEHVAIFVVLEKYVLILLNHTQTKPKPNIVSSFTYTALFQNVIYPEKIVSSLQGSWEVLCHNYGTFPMSDSDFVFSCRYQGLHLGRECFMETLLMSLVQYCLQGSLIFICFMQMLGG